MDFVAHLQLRSQKLLEKVLERFYFWATLITIPKATLDPNFGNSEIIHIICILYLILIYTYFPTCLLVNWRAPSIKNPVFRVKPSKPWGITVQRPRSSYHPPTWGQPKPIHPAWYPVLPTDEDVILRIFCYHPKKRWLLLEEIFF